VISLLATVVPRGAVVKVKQWVRAAATAVLALALHSVANDFFFSLVRSLRLGVDEKEPMLLVLWQQAKISGEAGRPCWLALTVPLSRVRLDRLFLRAADAR